MVKTMKSTPKIHIKIISVGYLKRYLDNKEEKIVEVPSKTSIYQVFEYLEIPSGEVMMATINGKHVHKDYILQNNDEIKIIPLMGGG